MHRAWLAILVVLLPGCAIKSFRTSEQTDTVAFPEGEWEPVAVSLLGSTENGAAFRRGPAFVAAAAATTPGRTGAAPSPVAAAAPSSMPAGAKPGSHSSGPPAARAAAGSEAEQGTQYVREGESVKFAASADGTPPLTYQWRKDGQPIPGQTNALLAFPRVSPADAGEYDCIVTNSAGQKASEPFELVVRDR